MSEREIRETLDLVTQELMQIAYNDMILSAVVPLLEEPPDLVVLLRWANNKRKCYLRLAEDAGRGYSWNPRYDEKFYRGKAGMAAEVQSYCQEFVRLTDEGWEWVEEGGDVE